MRRLVPRAKDRRKVAIPPDLRDSLREVLELIRRARRDPDVVLGYDDAIQTKRLTGGKFGKKDRPFVLTYFPDGDRERGRWHLALHRTDIEDIAEGRLTEITMYCCTAADCRCKFRDDEPCFYCDYIDDPNYGTFSFPAAESKLTDRGITGITQETSREEVVAALGPADASGGGMNNPPLGYMWPWVLFRRPDCQLRFEFDKAQKRIRNITILDKDWEPGK